MEHQFCWIKWSKMHFLTMPKSWSMINQCSEALIIRFLYIYTYMYPNWNKIIIICGHHAPYPHLNGKSISQVCLVNSNRCFNIERQYFVVSMSFNGPLKTQTKWNSQHKLVFQFFKCHCSYLCIEWTCFGFNSISFSKFVYRNAYSHRASSTEHRVHLILFSNAMCGICVIYFSSCSSFF